MAGTQTWSLITTSDYSFWVQEGFRPSGSNDGSLEMMTANEFGRRVETVSKPLL